MDGAVERVRIAFELHETGLAIQRQNLRRRHPHVGERELDKLFRAWVEDRPLDYSPT